MKVAVTVWHKRVSPVFDASHMLLVVDIENASVISREYISFDPETPSSLVQTLDRMGVSTLICGAVSEQPANVIEAGQITLIPFITGDADDVLKFYAGNADIGSSFLMPGCARDTGRKGKHRRVGMIQERRVNTMPKRDGTGPKNKGQKTGRKAQDAGKGKRGQGKGRGRVDSDRPHQGTGRVQGNPTH